MGKLPRTVMPVTLGQAAWALMFVVIYVVMAAAALLAVGLSGVCRRRSSCTG